jgi:4-hydroxy-3-polyprenylbenzoate decarboxylase
MAAAEDDPELDLHDIARFLGHVLARVDLGRDLHFHTRTTIDTLDYSGTGLNQGSKLVVAAVGRPRRSLGTAVPVGLRLPAGFEAPRVCLPGVLAVRGPVFAAGPDGVSPEVARLCEALASAPDLERFPLVVVVDDSELCARSLENFLWITFTRSNPAVDVSGGGASIVHKHWGCRGPLVIDARIKPHHAPPLVEDPTVSARVDRLFVEGGPLRGLG